MWERLVYDTDPPLPGDEPQAAVLAPVYPDDEGELRLVLTKRPDTMPTHAGHIAFPGGRPDPDDDGPVATALREAREEVGLDPATVEVLGFLPAVHTVSYSLMVVPVVGRLAGVPELQPCDREVVRVYLPTVAELADPERWWWEDWQGRKVWFFDLEGDVLWGATAWMIRNLVGLERP